MTGRFPRASTPFPLAGRHGADAVAVIDPQHLRHVFSHVPTGVTILTARTSQGPVGMACNSFGSVTLEPPLVLFCPAKASTTWPRIRAAGRLCCVNILARQHETLGRRLSLRGVDRFAAGRWHDRIGGPGLDDAAAWIDCTIEAEHEAGDHVIVVAAVLSVEAGRAETEPLVFHRRGYGSFLRDVSPLCS